MLAVLLPLCGLGEGWCMTLKAQLDWCRGRGRGESAAVPSSVVIFHDDLIISSPLYEEVCWGIEMEGRFRCQWW